MNIPDYESFAYFFEAPPRLDEMYSGQEVVAWQGRIERQLIKHIEEYEAARNPGYADKLRAFLQTWRQHQLTGSLNVETIDALLASCEVLGVDPWKLQTYFSNLRDNLRQLKASVEQLPVDAYSAARGSGAPPFAEPPPPSGGAPAEEQPAGGEAPAEETPAEGEPAPAAAPPPAA
jgi:hypothetical protein